MVKTLFLYNVIQVQTLHTAIWHFMNDTDRNDTDRNGMGNWLEREKLLNVTRRMEKIFKPKQLDADIGEDRFPEEED